MIPELSSLSEVRPTLCNPEATAHAVIAGIRICGSVGLVHNRSVTSLVWRQLQAALDEGAKESYEETENRGKTSAENLRVG